MEREVPPGQELPRSLRHHRRVEAGSPSGAGSFAELVADCGGSDDACGADALDADGVEEDRRADPVETKAPRNDRRTAAAASQR